MQKECVGGGGGGVREKGDTLAVFVLLLYAGNLI